MNNSEWLRLNYKKILYSIVIFPLGASLLLWQSDIDSRVSLVMHFLLWLVHSALISGASIFVAIQTGNQKTVLGAPLFWKFFLAVAYSILPLAFNEAAYIFVYEKTPDAFSIYLSGLICVFGGLTGLLIAKEIPRGEISKEYIESLYKEVLQIIWPYTFSFILTLLASPFVAQVLERLIDIKSLIAVVFLGMIGFASLIVIPLDNLSELRQELFFTEKRKE